MLTVRVMAPEERERFGRLEGTYHYMGQTRSGGDTLRLVFEEAGEWVALMVWGAACYRLKDRDDLIGWTPRLRAERQKLVVMNRRFTLLAPPGTRPNLASQVLGLAVRKLPGLWRRAHGYEPLLAETFSDIEIAAGTCYRAAGWLDVGQSKGFSRHRRDFYVPNDRPKRLWIKELRRGAVALLCASHLPPECARGADSDGWGVLPLTQGRAESLHEALCRVPDPRRHNRSFHIGSLLALLAMAVMGGAHSLARVVRFAQTLSLPQRKALGLPRFRPGSDYRKTPSYSAFYNLLHQLDSDALARVLSDWLRAQEGALPRQLALDGKYIGDVVGLVSLVNVETGVPVAMAPVSRKEGQGKRCELRVGRQMLAQTDLTRARVSMDALHAQHETLRTVALNGGEGLVQIKANQKTVLRTAQRLAAGHTPFLMSDQTKNTAARKPGAPSSTPSKTPSPSACPTSVP